MRRFKGLAALIAALTLVGLMMATIGVQPARAAPAAITLIHRATLAQTSIDGPAFISDSSFFEGVTTTRTVIAWTGTDAQHHLNVMTSKDKLTYGQKITLSDTSPYRPAVAQLLDPIGDVIVIAWTGTDPAHTLNVLWNVYGVSGYAQKKVTLWGDTAIGGPTLVTYVNGKFYLAWTGTDANHSLNVLPLAFGTLAQGTKVTLPQFSSNTGPLLSVNNATSTPMLMLNWTTRTQRLNLAGSTDGVVFTSAIGASGLPELSAAAPHSFFAQREGGPENWLAWTGTDAAHHLNVQWTSHYPQWPDPATTKTTLGDTALGGPEVAFNAGMFIAWTGTDAAHHLNVAEWDGF